MAAGEWDSPLDILAMDMDTPVTDTDTEDTMILITTVMVVTMVVTMAVTMAVAIPTMEVHTGVDTTTATITDTMMAGTDTLPLTTMVE